MTTNRINNVQLKNFNFNQNQTKKNLFYIQCYICKK